MSARARHAIVTGAVAALLLVPTALAVPAHAEGADAAGEADIVVFWGDGCPTSAEAMDWLDGFEATRPDVDVERVEVWDDDAGAERFAAVMASLDRQPRRVPTFVADGQVRVGFSDEVTEWLEAVVTEDNGDDDRALPPPGEIDEEALGPAVDEADPDEILGALRTAWWLAVATGVATILVAALAVTVWWQRRRARSSLGKPPPEGTPPPEGDPR